MFLWGNPFSFQLRIKTTNRTPLSPGRRQEFFPPLTGSLSSPRTMGTGFHDQGRAGGQAGSRAAGSVLGFRGRRINGRARVE